MRMAEGVEDRTNSLEDVYLGTRPLYVKVFEKTSAILSYLIGTARV